MNSKTLLVIDDEKKLCDLLARILELEGYTVHKAYTGKEGLASLQQHEISVVLCDVKLPDYSGIDLVALIKQQKPFVQIINLTAYGTIADSVKAMKNGAYDYITKGDDNDKIIPLVANAFEAAAKNKLQQIQKQTDSKGFEAIIGQSPILAEAINMARKVAPSEANVLLLGETGTGKEVFAKAIHQASKHTENTLMAINCSAISADLLESELFGYKKGAFTGALADKKGLLEQADGGTLFLDEIGDMPLHMQAKILRVLEDGTFIKLGDLQTKKVSVRVIAATHKNLLAEVEKGNFREDLYYRLSVFTLQLPKLNDRKKDILLLAEHFIKLFSSSVIQMSEDFKDALLKHNWKGNIRELKNTIERTLILNEAEILHADLLTTNFNSSTETITNSLNMASVEEIHIKKVLQYTSGNKTETARLLGIGLATLYRKMEQYGILKY
ncbi:sigma-54-dependent transcriptional regulator [Pedobacter xixiisoli]|uniref:DNA-binding transcriptional response regulator, NtrC family, contains REC, AAA-type ATPase, and a Fis-type DNA-binding domains n=1 Tax=Pedobacter xixiisoli TaxID=1476464 RepID=A0A285ZSI6_9SPHI|nr:sigma-54 dependent transcriptional regulator [Pedobacter xixiisoli]SOD12608.1 DNA-binding transcriptional response regulator, NtrC family, contains REC, AAA-type ATPase, and a Fis-type DNA-binding domains [Pedobacter xixiisoli]